MERNERKWKKKKRKKEWNERWSKIYPTMSPRSTCSLVLQAKKEERERGWAAQGPAAGASMWAARAEAVGREPAYFNFLSFCGQNDVVLAEEIWFSFSGEAKEKINSKVVVGWDSRRPLAQRLLCPFIYFFWVLNYFYKYSPLSHICPILSNLYLKFWQLI